MHLLFSLDSLGCLAHELPQYPTDSQHDDDR